MNATVMDVLEFFGAAITMALFALLAWLFIIITPDQCSAESDRAAVMICR